MLDRIVAAAASIRDVARRLRYRRAALLRMPAIEGQGFTPVTVPGSARPSLGIECPVNSRVAYKVAVPDRASVVVSCRLSPAPVPAPSTLPQQGDCTFELVVSTESEEVSARHVVRAARRADGLHVLRVRLSKGGVALIRLVITSDQPGDPRHIPQGFWVNPSIEWPRPMGQLAGLVRATVSERGLRSLWYGLAPPHGERLFRLWQREQRISQREIRAQRTWSSTHTRLLSLTTFVSDASAWQRDPAPASVLAQTYGNWEWILVTTAGTRAVLETIARRDARVRLITIADAATPADAWNAALGEARGEFLALLNPGDSLEPGALYEMARALDTAPDCDLVYSDEDRFDPAVGRRSDPRFKPDWSPDYLLSCNYIGRLALLRTSVAKDAGGFRNLDGADGSTGDAAEWGLLLRACGPSARVRRVPRCLYHRGRAAAQGSGPAERVVIRDHYARLGLNADVTAVGGAWRGVWPVAPVENAPLVSIVIPNKNAAAVLGVCVKGLLEDTAYRRVELVIVDNGSTEPEALGLYRQLEQKSAVKIIPFDRPFNFSAACNAGAAASTGELLLFLNNDIEVIDPDWLTELVRWAERPAIGVVGAKLLYPNRMIQHAGVVCGPGGLVDHIFSKAPEGTNGVFGSPETYRNYLAVTGACQMMRRDVYDRLGGFDERFRISFSDVVLCLEAWKAGYRVVYTPYARLIHHESYSRKREDSSNDVELLVRDLRRRGFSDDPFFHPELSARSLVPVLRSPFEPMPGRVVGDFIDRVLAAADATAVSVQGS